MRKFFSFEKMVTPSLIKILYILVALSITLGGLTLMLESPLEGIAIIIFGNLFWRVSAEITIILFSIHENLVKIKRQKQTTDTADTDK